MSDRTVNGFPAEYLGDGVYATFDGYQIWLHVGDHRAAPVVAIEPSTLAALNAYYNRLLQKRAPSAVGTGA